MHAPLHGAKYGSNVLYRGTGVDFPVKLVAYENQICTNYRRTLLAARKIADALLCRTAVVGGALQKQQASTLAHTKQILVVSSCSFITSAKEVIIATTAEAISRQTRKFAAPVIVHASTSSLISTVFVAGA